MLEITFALPDALHDACAADLAGQGFDGFWEEPGRMRAYLPAARWTPERRAALDAWLDAHGVRSDVAVRRVEERDWEAESRAQAAPVTAGRFLIRPSWAASASDEAGREVITIDPKMSFGTGGHASTRLVLRLLDRRAPVSGRVLDAGSGTGVLAVAALRLGADAVVAFDIDPWAASNAAETFSRNGVRPERVDFRTGSLDVVPETGFALVLANITASVLTEMLPGLAARLAPDGAALFSGVTRDERPAFAAAVARTGFVPDDSLVEDEWWAGAFTIPPRP